MPVISLTRRAITALPPSDKVETFYDADLVGFGLRRTPPSQKRRKGRSAWFVEYRPHGGGRGVAKKRMVFGDAAKLTPEEARKEARTLLSRVNLGEDPMAARVSERRAEMTLDLLQEYLDRHVRSKCKPSTAASYAVYLNKHLLSWKTRKANSITRDDVDKKHAALGEKHPAAANRLLVFVGGAYSWASKNGLLPKGFENPARGIRKFEESRRERYLSADEFARLGQTLALAETRGIPWEPDPAKPKANRAAKPENRRVIVDSFAVAAIRLLILTGCRLREILHLRWSEVDLERGFFYLPDSKTGSKTVILGAPAVDILASLPRLGVYVIAGEDLNKPRADLQRPWARVTEHAGLAGLRIHDLRHSFASVGAGGGLGLPIVGRLLGHKNASTTQRYAHLGDDPLRKGVNAIAESIATQLRASRETPSASMKSPE